MNKTDQVSQKTREGPREIDKVERGEGGKPEAETSWPQSKSVSIMIQNCLSMEFQLQCPKTEQRTS